ncbi:hypothetical protein ACK325_02620 [Aeromonas hydrophila]|uniref:hypothetical protein n=1 Tax=Aeromonas hydrophila TaxID=644 RepID=UPI003988B5C3
MINEIVMRERGVVLRKEVLIPMNIQSPFVMEPPVLYKPSLPYHKIAHPLVEYGVKHSDGHNVAWFKLDVFDHRFENKIKIVVNGETLWKRIYFFKD